MNTLEVGRKIVTDPMLLLTLPIINLPAGTKRIRIRQRSRVPRLYIKTGNSLQTFIAGFVDDDTAIELIPQRVANFTRKIL
jgi:hypothetical protein